VAGSIGNVAGKASSIGNVAGSDEDVAGRNILVGKFGGEFCRNHFPCLSQLHFCEWYVNNIGIALFLNE